MSLKMRYGNTGTPEKKSVSVFNVSEDNLTAGASTYTQYTIDVSRAGFTPVGIVGFEFANATDSGSGCSFISAYAMRIDGTNAVLYVRNSRASAAKIMISLDVLYV